MINKIYSKYEKYKVKEFKNLLFSYKNYQKILNKINLRSFQTEIAGKSFLDKQIYSLKIGKGSKKIILWSQMHGNEPINTQALLDLINFFNFNDNFNAFRQNILKKCTIYFVPLLNPDGAEKFTRRNAQGIDLNRDALKKTSPEAKILYQIIEKIKPDFAFNLHDQERYYGTENSNYPTAMSFLTPSFDKIKTIDASREKSMKVIVSIFKMLQNYLPQSLAKYNDKFMQAAFGDNVQKLKISTILFEAGYIIGDEQRQKIRKFYFLSLIYALKIIANSDYNNNTITEYQEIPMNIKRKFFDYIFKNLTIKQNGKEFVTDIAVVKNILDSEVFSDLIDQYLIWDIGDLSNKKAFKKINCKRKIFKGKIKRLQNAEELIKTLLN